mgnify:CR=1 FL=1
MSFQSLLNSFKEPLKIGAAVVGVVGGVAKKGAEVKAKWDYLNTDTDNTGLTQAQDIQASIVKIGNRINGDPALKTAPEGETDTKRHEREAKLAIEHTTVKLAKKTKEEWTKEAQWYQAETKVLGAFISGAFIALFDDVHGKQLAALQGSAEGGIA